MIDFIDLSTYSLTVVTWWRYADVAALPAEATQDVEALQTEGLHSGSYPSDVWCLDIDRALMSRHRQGSDDV